ncbi:TetR/AcrR family transcriptional regulator [Subtercola lobariae]|uniref:TetR family transcriptional regulator n=1 Tax=Subtercola lobariae TaxID=1588641 RepID=A0A917BED3_9MICO|nr:TetR/AcrR family transcriptional regulator [Subtercola lobariae]GGF39308.1 TetR family transcriptional regulator [Subtercola lobariae]
MTTADPPAEQAYHHGSLRQALLARAETSLAEVGADNLSLRQLARDIGVSHGAPARHFRDKQALLDALAVDGFTTMNAALSAAAASTGTYRERFDRVAVVYVGFAREHPDLLQLMYATKHRETASAELSEVGEAGMLACRDLLREAQDARVLAPGDTDLLSLVAFAQLHGIALLASGNMLGDVSPEAAVAATTDLLWAGLTNVG